jgi:ADP-ribose pyrophosphatase
MSSASWKTLETRAIYRAQAPDEVSFNEDRIALPSGDEFRYVYVHSPYEVVFVVGFDGAGNVVMLRQHRHLVQEELWEIPAGSPEGNETLTDGALREFEEESGFKAGQITHVCSFYPSVGITDQVNHTFVAWDLTKSSQQLEDSELISVKLMSVDEALRLVYAGEVKNVGAAYSLLMAKHWLDKDVDKDQILYR